jgi:Mn-dependent DtxR family transcriptional regulator
MATTGTTRAKPPSAEAILDALRLHPDAPAAELAEAVGIGRSTAAKTLATLEAQGRVTRQRGTPEGGKATPDRWTLAPDPRTNHSDPDPAEPQAASDARVTEPADTTKIPAEAPSAEAAPLAGTAGLSEAEATVKGSPDAAESSAQRLRPGALRSLIHAWLAERPGQEFTSTRISKELGRSAGAVGNALTTMTDQGEVVQTSRTPRRYAIAEDEDQAGATR